MTLTSPRHYLRRRALVESELQDDVNSSVLKSVNQVSTRVLPKFYQEIIAMFLLFVCLFVCLLFSVVVFRGWKVYLSFYTVVQNM